MREYSSKNEEQLFQDEQIRTEGKCVDQGAWVGLEAILVAG